jgi:hypothetical protein
LKWILDKKREGSVEQKLNRHLKTTSFTSHITPLIRLDGETYSCQQQLPGPKVQGSTAVAFVAEFLTPQKILKPIREWITAHTARHLQA